MIAASSSLVTYEQWSRSLFEAEALRESLVDRCFALAVQERTPEEDVISAACFSEVEEFDRLIAFLKFGTLS